MLPWPVDAVGKVLDGTIRSGRVAKVKVVLRSDAPFGPTGLVKVTERGRTLAKAKVVRTDDGFLMVFRTEAGAFGFGLARSPDGTTWEPSEANPVMDEDRSPSGEPFWQSEAVVIDDEVRWWLEVGYATGTTELYAFRLDVNEAW